MVLDEATIIKKTIDVHFQLKFEYVDLNKVMRIIKENKLEILKQIMALNCELVVSVRKSNASKIEAFLKDLRCLKIIEIKK